jgi:hypothetical protein
MEKRFKLFFLCFLLSVSAISQNIESVFDDNNHFGVGFSQLIPVISSDDQNDNSNGSLSLWYDFGAVHCIQMLMWIGSSESEDYGVGLQYKYSISKKKYSSFYIGLGIGSSGGFTNSDREAGVNFAGIIGFRFIPHSMSNIVVSFEGGPAIQGDGSYQTRSGFSLTPILGLNVHYIF